MKKIRFAIVLSLFLISLGFSACKKDVEPTKTDILASNTWKYDEVSYIIGGNSNLVTVYRRGASNNAIDVSQIRIKFGTDGTFTRSGIPSGTASSTWQFLNNETQLTIAGDAVPTWGIDRITATNFDYNITTTVVGQSVKYFYKCTPQ